MKRFLWIIVGLLGCGGYLQAAEVSLFDLERDLFEAQGLPSFNDYNWALYNELSVKLDLIAQLECGEIDYSDQLSQPSSPALSRAASTESRSAKGDEDFTVDRAGVLLFGENDEDVDRSISDEQSNFEEMLPLMDKVRNYDTRATADVSKGLDNKEIEPNNVAYVEFLLNEISNVSYENLIGSEWIKKQSLFFRLKHDIKQRLFGDRIDLVPSAAKFFDDITSQNDAAEARFNEEYVDPFTAVAVDSGEYGYLFGSDGYLPAAPESAANGKTDWDADGALDEL